ncbi:hypothetical protein HDU96_006478 [Phlyctochytrium bullatum]|nr:hypothetical protein HDU96_006478 [Phlyctochytrium bullatum]
MTDTPTTRASSSSSSSSTASRRSAATETPASTAEPSVPPMPAPIPTVQPFVPLAAYPPYDPYAQIATSAAAFMPFLVFPAYTAPPAPFLPAPSDPLSLGAVDPVTVAQAAANSFFLAARNPFGDTSTGTAFQPPTTAAPDLSSAFYVDPTTAAAAAAAAAVVAARTGTFVGVPPNLLTGMHFFPGMPAGYFPFATPGLARPPEFGFPAPPLDQPPAPSPVQQDEEERWEVSPIVDVFDAFDDFFQSDSLSATTIGTPSTAGTTPPMSLDPPSIASEPQTTWQAPSSSSLTTAPDVAGSSPPLAEKRRRRRPRTSPAAAAPYAIPGAGTTSGPAPKGRLVFPETEAQRRVRLLAFKKVKQHVGAASSSVTAAREEDKRIEAGRCYGCGHEFKGRRKSRGRFPKKWEKSYVAVQWWHFFFCPHLEKWRRRAAGEVMAEEPDEVVGAAVVGETDEEREMREGARNWRRVEVCDLESLKVALGLSRP